MSMLRSPVITHKGIMPQKCPDLNMALWLFIVLLRSFWHVPFERIPVWWQQMYLWLTYWGVPLHILCGQLFQQMYPQSEKAWDNKDLGEKSFRPCSGQPYVCQYRTRKRQMGTHNEGDRWQNFFEKGAKGFYPSAYTVILGEADHCCWGLCALTHRFK